MKKKRFIIGSMIIFLGIIMITLGMHYKYRLAIRKQPPSDKWSKEVIISNGNIKARPGIEKINENYYIVHNDGSNLKMLKIDDLGTKLKEVEVDGKSEFISCIEIYNEEENMFLSWIYSKKGIKNLVTVKLDKELNIVNTEKIENIVSSKKVDNNLRLIAYNDKVEIQDIDGTLLDTIKDSSIENSTAAKMDEGYLITYYNPESSMLRAAIFSNNMISKTEDVIMLSKGRSSTFGNMALAYENGEAHLIMENYSKGEFTGTNHVEFSTSDFKGQIEKLSYDNNNRFIKDIAPIKTEEGAGFMATALREYGKKQVNRDVMSFNLSDIKNGYIEEFDFASRSKNLSYLSNGSDEVAVYADYNDFNNYNLCMVSTSQQFKDKYNEVNSKEVKLAIGDIIDSFAYCIAYIFTIGIGWMFPALAIMGVFTFFDYKFNEKQRKIGLIICGVLATIMKIYVIKNVFYVQNLHMLSESMKSFGVGAGICIAASILSYGYAYKRYCDDTEVVTLIRSSTGLMIDTILTLMVFVPFIK